MKRSAIVICSMLLLSLAGEYSIGADTDCVWQLSIADNSECEAGADECTFWCSSSTRNCDDAPWHVDLPGGKIYYKATKVPVGGFGHPVTQGERNCYSDELCITSDRDDQRCAFYLGGQCHPKVGETCYKCEENVFADFVTVDEPSLEDCPDEN